MNVKPLFKLMVEKKASDLFFAPFTPAKIKIEGKIMPVNKLEMSPKMVRQAALELMNEEQLEDFTRELELDFAISEPGLGRFRVNVFHQRGNVSMVLRYITAELPTLDELGMPEQLKDLVEIFWDEVPVLGNLQGSMTVRGDYTAPRLEDIDLRGHVTRHGPVTVEVGPGTRQIRDSPSSQAPSSSGSARLKYCTSASVCAPHPLTSASSRFSTAKSLRV